MKVLNVTNVHEALPRALHLLHTEGVRRESRNGPVLQHPEPVATVYARPRERVIFHEWRDANPFFHFYESLWMLAGRADVKPLTRYVGRMSEFSDDGKTFNAPYGHRWRNARDSDGEMCRDQLRLICDALRRNPEDRQQVLQIWDHIYDLGTPTRDHACNLTATFQVNAVTKHLDMVVLCRSNDIIWGAYGANAVHLSMLLEYVADRAGYQVGTYTQVSVNWHGYMTTVEPILEFKSPDDASSPYETEPVYPAPISQCTTEQDWERWDMDCREFVTSDGRAAQFRPGDRFFNEVAFPIVRAHDAWKDYPTKERHERAIHEIKHCQASDWRMACEEWLDRRQEAWERGYQDGVHTEYPVEQR